jgi:predicted lipoprotein
MKKISIGILTTCLLFNFTACKKKSTSSTDIASLKKDILYDISHEVCTASYIKMHEQCIVLEQSIVNLQSATTEANLQICRSHWKAVRETWENTESWLFGPISANNIDPRIDTWPVDFNAIDSVLHTSNVFTPTYIENLEDALKGFHPIEYFLWGSNGNKSATAFTPREMEYLIALSQNLSLLAKEVKETWENGYANELAKAGNGSNNYTSQQIAFVELADAMSGICDEVANGKMNDPFIAQNALLEESPFAKNSLVDFTNNIQGVMKLYQGYFDQDKLGIEDLVREYNLSIDQEFKAKHQAAIASLQSISVPFGEAIFTQQVLVQQAIDNINSLEEVISQKIRPFILQHVQ